MQKLKILNLQEERRKIKTSYLNFYQILTDYYGDNIELKELQLSNTADYERQTVYGFPDYYAEENKRRYFTNYKFSFTILFPEITITNTVDRTHLIKDLLVRVTCKNTQTDFEGMRLTVSKKEYASEYIHSHLPKRKYLDFSYFCLGNNTAISNLKTESLLNLSFEEQIMFPYILQDYISWESLEGGPYILIEQIGSFKLYEEELSNVLPFYSDQYFNHQTNLKLGKDFKIKNQREISEQLGFIETIPRVIDINGQLHTEFYNDKLFESRPIIFKNQTIYTKIYDTENQNTKYYAHPKYLEEYCNYWEAKCYQSYVTSCYAKTES